MTRQETLRLQKQINAAGNGPVEEDGIAGPKTEAAYARMLKDSNAGGVGTRMPVPPAWHPWWSNRALIGFAGAALAGWMQSRGWPVDVAALVDFLLQVVSVISMAFGLWGVATQKSRIDPTLVARIGSRDVRLPSVLTDPVPPQRPGGRGSATSYDDLLGE